MDCIFDSDTLSEEELEKIWTELQNIIRDLEKENVPEIEK
ncbi:hypothetical protein Ga0466249_003667 [Sporomusaceae bacterium BoRhaA]|nr:hypothetical protein [Pelorhabdus rhamnosifermentans]